MSEYSMTLNELIYDIWETVRPIITDDDLLDTRKFKMWIHNQRALWLRNELNKNRTIDDNLIQDLGCLDVEKVDASSCCDVDTDCWVLRTVEEIPITIERYNEPTITRVGPISKLEKGYSMISFSRVPYILSGKYTKLGIRSFLLNKRIHLIGAKNNLTYTRLKKINVMGVFENPEDVSAFSTCEGVICYDDDSRYPINRWMVPYLKDAILKADLSLLITRPIDNTNNSEGKATDGQQILQG